MRACAGRFDGDEAVRRRIMEALAAVAGEHGLTRRVARYLVCAARTRYEPAVPRDEVVRRLRDMQGREAPVGLGWCCAHADAIERCALRLLPAQPPA